MKLGVQDFSRVNMLYGYAGGSDALRQLADRLRALLPPGGELFRSEGPRFTLCLPGEDRGAAEKLYQAIRAAAEGEIRLGVWEDQTWQALQNRYPEEMDHFSSRLDLWRAEGAETAQQLVDRFIPALRRVAEAHDGGTVAVFSHGAALRVVLGVLQGLSLAEVGTKPHGDNTAVSLLTWENGTFRVEYRDDNSHLAERGLSTFAKQTWWQDGRMKDQGSEYRPLPETERGRFGVPTGDEATGIWYGDALIGAFSFRREADGLRLTRYILAPEWRGRRLGVPPMGQVLRYCRHQELPWLRLTCADRALRLFFARLGFVAAVGDEMVKDARCVLPPLPAAYMR